MLLLLQLLLEQDAVERNRLLIDNLVKLSRRSAASICRQAGVQPANLTRFRQPGGETQVSEELQSKLLQALEWPNGSPAPQSIHKWEVSDPAGQTALNWLLRQEELKDAQFLKVEAVGRKGENNHICAGKLTEAGACCVIYINTDTPVVNPRLTRIPIVPVGKELGRAIVNGNVCGHELLQLFESALAPFPVQSRLMPDLVASIEAMGMTREEHNQLLQSWLVNLSRQNPSRAINILRRLEKVALNGRVVAPKAMTAKELDKLILELATLREYVAVALKS